MKREYFENVLEDIYAIFGKKYPAESRIVDIIWNKIGELPESFMDYAKDCLEEEEKLPANLVRYFMRQCWPNFLEKHPELRASRSYECQECGGTGYIHGYSQDGLEYGFVCICKDRDKGWTKDRIRSDPKYRLDDPMLANADISYWKEQHDFIKRSLGAFEPRPKHVEYMQNNVDF